MKKHQFNEYFIINYNEDSNIGYLIKVYVQYLETVLNLGNDLQFLPGKIKLKMLSNLYPTCMIKKNIS